MLILHWLSAATPRKKLFFKNESPDSVHALEASLRAAMNEAGSLGSLALSRNKIGGLVSLVEQIRLEVGKLESGASLTSATPKRSGTPGGHISPKRSSRTNETPAMRIARRLFTKGLSVSEISRKTLLPESILVAQLRPPAPRTETIEIIREQVLL